jgi:hypothetical protein
MRELALNALDGSQVMINPILLMKRKHQSCQKMLHKIYVYSMANYCSEIWTLRHRNKRIIAEGKP